MNHAHRADVTYDCARNPYGRHIHLFDVTLRCCVFCQQALFLDSDGDRYTRRLIIQEVPW